MYVTHGLHLVILAVLLPIAQNYDVPLWKQRACEKAQKQKANSHYICDDKGDVKCLPGWQGDLCQVPMCRRGCDPMNGYCQRPGECRCRIGYTGEMCDKCIPLPGCQHGDCTKPFECLCRPGWTGLFCTEPTCRPGCHSTRGYCEAPGECRCRLGWAGRNCSDCSVLPGCQHGTCNKPLECNCKPGYTGLLCQTAICNADCHKQRGYCKKPGECRCKVGWTGPKCDQCFPYPGCVNGSCEKPWECNCKPGWGGILCDEELTYCKENPNTCENGGKCVSLAKGDGYHHCRCRQGYLGKNCEIVDEFLLTSTAAPRITPPPLVSWDDDEDDDDVNVIDNVVNNQKEKITTKNYTSPAPTTVISSTEKVLMESGSVVSTGSIEFPTTPTTLAFLSGSPMKTENVYLASTTDVIGTATTATMQATTPSSASVKVDGNINNKLHNSPPPPNIRMKINPTIKTTNQSSISPSNNKELSMNDTQSGTISPLSKLEEEKHQPSMGNVLKVPQKPEQSSIVLDVVTTSNGDDDDDEEDEDCDENDNDEDCEYVDDDEEE